MKMAGSDLLPAYTLLLVFYFPFASVLTAGTTGNIMIIHTTADALPSSFIEDFFLTVCF